MNGFAGPLSGIKVLDLTTVFMGPLATQVMGDLGADVIKVEAPGGDSTRTMGPNGEHGLGPLFLGLNRNKRSIVIDLKTAATQQIQYFPTGGVSTLPPTPVAAFTASDVEG